MSILSFNHDVSILIFFFFFCVHWAISSAVRDLGGNETECGERERRGRSYEGFPRS